MTNASSLSGIRVLLTRDKAQNAGLAKLLCVRGAVPVLMPAIETEARDPENGPRVMRDWNSFRWIAFTSKNAVRFFKEWLDMARLPLPPHVKVAAVGHGTAQACAAAGFPVDLVPETSTGAALGERLVSEEEPSPILLPRGISGLSDLPGALESAGWETVPLEIYSTRRATLDSEAVAELERGVDAAVFASPSAVASLMERLPLRAGRALRRARCLPIGPTTAEALRAAGLVPAALPPAATPREIIKAIEALFDQRP